MKKKLIIFGLVFLLIPIIFAETAFYIKTNENYDVKFSCENNGGICSPSAYCYVDINYPNSTVLINHQNATNLNNGYFNYTLNSTQTDVNGEYTAKATCIDGNLNDTSVFIYEVNPTGIRPSDQRTDAISRGIWFTAVIAILLFIGFLFTRQPIPVKWTFFGSSFIFFLITLNILFVGLRGEAVDPKLVSFFDSFTAIFWILFWFVAGLLILMWLFTFINTWLYKKNMRNAKKYGLY